METALSACRKYFEEKKVDAKDNCTEKALEGLLVTYYDSPMDPSVRAMYEYNAPYLMPLTCK